MGEEPAANLRRRTFGIETMMKTTFLAAVTSVALLAFPANSGWVGLVMAGPQEESHEGEHHGEDHGEGHASHDDGHDGDHVVSGHGGDGEHADGSHGGEHGDGHAAHGNTNPLSVDPDLAIFTAVIFGLLAVILRKFAWGPIRDAVEEREKRIADQLAEAQRSNEEARRLLDEHESKLASSSEEVKTMLDEAKRDAESQKNRIIAEAEEAAAAQKARVVREIDAAKNSALETLAQSSVDQAVSLAGRIVGQSLNKDDHGKLIQDALKQFPSDN
jgi:F-type H+-transporting ATPase subunit b